jgi:hypothetical protein
LRLVLSTLMSVGEKMSDGEKNSGERARYIHVLVATLIAMMEWYVKAPMD